MRVPYLILGYIFLAIAFIGVFLPLLPTTPFLILAAYFFSKGSARIYLWLRNHPSVGPALVDWETHHRIRKPVKQKATALILISFALTLTFVKVGILVKMIVCLIGVFCLIFIWSRPS